MSCGFLAEQICTVRCNVKLGEGGEEEGEEGRFNGGGGGCDWPSVFARLREAATASTLPKRKIGSSGSLPPAAARRTSPALTVRHSRLNEQTFRTGRPVLVMRGRGRLHSSCMDSSVLGASNWSLCFLNPVWPGRGAECEPELDGWLWGKEEDPRRLMCAECSSSFCHSSPPVSCLFFCFVLFSYALSYLVDFTTHTDVGTSQNKSSRNLAN